MLRLVWDEEKGRGQPLRLLAPLLEHLLQTLTQCTVCLGGFTASFQYRLQTAAAANYKKLNKKGEPKVILTDDTLHRAIFYLAKSKSYSPLHTFL